MDVDDGSTLTHKEARLDTRVSEVRTRRGAATNGYSTSCESQQVKSRDDARDTVRDKMRDIVRDN